MTTVSHFIWDAPSGWVILKFSDPCRGGLGSQTGRGKYIKAALFSLFLCEWAALNQAAHVAIAKMPQRPVRLWIRDRDELIVTCRETFRDFLEQPSINKGDLGHNLPQVYDAAIKKISTHLLSFENASLSQTTETEEDHQV